MTWRNLRSCWIFPQAPKLDLFGKIDPAKASPAELQGQEIFFGKGQCAACHVPPFYTANLMHNLQLERFYKSAMINGLMSTADGPIKTFPLRGIKESPPYLHDGTPVDTRRYSRILQPRAWVPS
jgi:cytochrome c peroxidase